MRVAAVNNVMIPIIVTMKTSGKFVDKRPSTTISPTKYVNLAGLHAIQCSNMLVVIERIITDRRETKATNPGTLKTALKNTVNVSTKEYHKPNRR